MDGQPSAQADHNRAADVRVVSPAPDFRAQALARSGVKPVAFMAPDAAQGCSGNRIHAVLCSGCARLWTPGPQIRAAAYTDRDGDSQCRNLIDGGEHDQSITLIRSGEKTGKRGGVRTASPRCAGVPK